MPIKISPTAKNQFTLFALPGDEVARKAVYGWATWFTERNIPFALTDDERGLAVWKIQAQDCKCESCQTEFVSHEGKRRLCDSCAVKLIKKLGIGTLKA